MTKIDHIGIATDSIPDSIPFWEALGFTPSGGGLVEDQGVKVRYLVNESDTRIELLEPTSSSTPVGKFIQKKGVGIQQLAISVDDVSETISKLLEMGIKMINTVPQIGHGGNKICLLYTSPSPRDGW